MNRRALILVPVMLLGLVGVALGQGRQTPDAGQEHIPASKNGVYASYPPTSGQHWGYTWANWKMYDQPVRPEEYVHNLEHGGIVLLYRCDNPCPDLVKALRELYTTFPHARNGKVKMVVSPDRKITSPIVILAWTWIDELPRMDRDRLLRFYREHVDRGPEDVP